MERKIKIKGEKARKPKKEFNGRDRGVEKEEKRLITGRKRKRKV